MKRIVLTGGPGAGKTVVSAAIAAKHPDRLVRVPEAATQVYENLQTRWDRLDIDGRRDAQRRMFDLQIEQENRLAAEFPDRILLLDRGTIDGAAYWPDSSEKYWPAMKTTRRAQLSRYDAVIWMESCAALGLYDGDASNACRFEDAAGAVRSGKVLLELWGDHPNLRRVGAFTNLDDKIAAVNEIIRELIFPV